LTILSLNSSVYPDIKNAPPKIELYLSNFRGALQKKWRLYKRTACNLGLVPVKSILELSFISQTELKCRTRLRIYKILNFYNCHEMNFAVVKLCHKIRRNVD